MRVSIGLLLASALPLLAQQSSVTAATSVDINGNVVLNGPSISQTRSDDASQTLVATQSINGRSVPLEEVEQKVIRNDASGKVTERITRRYDPQGNPLPPVRQVIEEQKRAGGGSTIQSTTYSTDFNGNTQVTEKSVTEIQKNSAGQTSQTDIQRPTVNGLATVEKQTITVNKQGDDNFQSDSTTYRSDGNGGFYAAARETDRHTVQGSQISDNSAQYERDSSGELALHGQTVTTTVTRPDGSSDSVVDIYSRNVPGVAGDSGSAMKLQEEQTVASAPGPGNTTIQTLSVRRPTVSDPGTLGAPRQLSQTVCKGDCKPPKADK